jgi:hypothetical protein
MTVVGILAMAFSWCCLTTVASSSSSAFVPHHHAVTTTIMKVQQQVDDSSSSSTSSRRRSLSSAMLAASAGGGSSGGVSSFLTNLFGGIANNKANAAAAVVTPSINNGNTNKEGRLGRPTNEIVKSMGCVNDDWARRHSRFGIGVRWVWPFNSLYVDSAMNAGECEEDSSHFPTVEYLNVSYRPPWYGWSRLHRPGATVIVHGG